MGAGFTIGHHASQPDCRRLIVLRPVRRIFSAPLGSDRQHAHWPGTQVRLGLPHGAWCVGVADLHRDFSQDISRVERSFSPKLGIQWSPDKRSSAYLTWPRGYKSSGFNAMPPNDTGLQYGPERASSLELSAKTLTRLCGEPLSISADVFWANFKNL